MTGSGISSREAILREASNLRMLETGQTPLLGEANPMLMDGGAGTGVGLKDKDAMAIAGEFLFMNNVNLSIVAQSCSHN